MMPCPGVGRRHGDGVFCVACADIRGVYSHVNSILEEYGGKARICYLDYVVGEENEFGKEKDKL
jgi:hypothetical protein